ncbi:peptide deformylase [Bacteroides hominis]|uniref:peptide deformylase n=1 Tax=Bacteroides hominis TaxID=2763023 RepID=UPI0022765C9C|nr:peptide deformylase [Bacteroides fragilis]MCY2671999.1 peptide deformylase [Bacteroides fragilis]MDA1493556.1 peptide deformylase [Bacteroides fragilis]
MKLPILVYGQPVLRKTCEKVDMFAPELDRLITDMWETLRDADGCGLAASQVGSSLQLFIVNSRDTFLYMDKQERTRYFEGDTGIQETFINAEILARDDERMHSEEEGCLSLPGMSERVKRPWSITVHYFDRDRKEHTRTFRGYTARVIQHEYDHTLGKLYIDRLDSLRRNLIANKLKKFAAGTRRGK